MATVQCDLCSLPLIITNTETVMVSLGWQLATAEAPFDACPACRHAHDGRIPGQLRRDGLANRVADGRLPNVLIIGAAKSGTTTVHKQLGAHPDIFMTPLKELRFFSDPDNLSWLTSYQGLLASDRPVVGESSTMYSRSPAIPGASERIHALVPDVRIIYLVREPVERALASYVEERFHGLEPRPAVEAFDDIDDPYNPYVAASRYAEQLDPFLKRFSRDQIRVVALDDLATDPRRTVRGLYEFLDVDPDVRIDVQARANQRSEKLEYPGLAGRLRRSSAAYAVRRLPSPVRARLTKPVRRLLTTPIDAPTLPADRMQKLRAAIAPDTARLRDMTGLELASWSV